jgi:hypothetical protein
MTDPALPAEPASAFETERLIDTLPPSLMLIRGRPPVRVQRAYAAAVDETGRLGYRHEGQLTFDRLFTGRTHGALDTARRRCACSGGPL